MQETTIAAIATAPGAGGIAVVRLSGAQSYAVAERVFRPANPGKKVAQAKGYTALFGHFVDGGEEFDEGVALFFRAPHSYTGEDVVELSCHGGSAVARRLVEACLAAGAQPAAPGEYTRRAFLNGKLGLTQAEAVMDLISADGRQGAALANAALSGALARKIGEQKDALTALQAHLVAWVDFPEEDVPELDEAHLRSVLGSVQETLDGLIRNYQADTVLREGVDCAIVGRPNAGKSTFISRISAARPKIAAYPFTTLTPNLGVVIDEYDPDQRMVVADIPGLIEGASEGQGLGHRFLKHVERTRFLVHILSIEDVNPEENPWAGFDLVNDELNAFDEDLGLRRQLQVINKIDLLTDEELTALRERAKADGRHIFFISAEKGIGLEELVDELWRRLDNTSLHAPLVRPVRVESEAEEEVEAGDDEFPEIEVIRTHEPNY